MEEEIKPGMTRLYISTMEGKTFKLDAKADPIEWPGTSDQKSDAKLETKTFSATLEFKMKKRMRERFIWAVNGCKTRKEYRRFKKKWKRIQKDTRIINEIKGFDNPKKLKSLERIKKAAKNGKILIVKV